MIAPDRVDRALDQAAQPVRPASRAAAATRGAWNRAASGLMSGSRPEPEAVTRSTGAGRSALASSASTRAAIALLQVGIVRPQVRAAGRVGLVVDGRRPRMEVTVRLEPLGDQLRADHRPAVRRVNQAACRLGRKQQLGQSPHDRRVGDRTENEGDGTGPQGRRQHRGSLNEVLLANRSRSASRPASRAGRWRYRSA